jgi:hypothetical protein
MKIDIKDIKKFTIESDEYLIITLPEDTPRKELDRFSRQASLYFKNTPIKGRVLIVQRGVEFEKLKIKEVKK